MKAPDATTARSRRQWFTGRGFGDLRAADLATELRPIRVDRVVR